MERTFSDADLAEPLARLDRASAAHRAAYPGPPEGPQPIHVVYGGAHRFSADVAQKMGRLALASVDAFAHDWAELAGAVGLADLTRLPHSRSEREAFARAVQRDFEGVRERAPGYWLAAAVYQRVREKLEREPVEAYCVDFEDGYGRRPDDEEDAHAARAAEQMARGTREGALPRFMGIRIKNLYEPASRRRALRTLDLFLTGLARAGGPPPDFTVTLPKIEDPEQVRVLAEVLGQLEAKLSLPRIGIEVMVETTALFFEPSGRFLLPTLREAAGGRLVAAHLGPYDFTADVGVVGDHQRLDHPVCDLARGLMQLAFTDAGVRLGDGPTTEMPIPPHRGPSEDLSPEQLRQNREAVHHAWREHFLHVRAALARAFYLGWDLHPAQLPVRYAAVFAFYLESMHAAGERLGNFVRAAGHATRVGQAFDDAATARTLVRFFQAAVRAGAIREQEAEHVTGIEWARLAEGLTDVF